MSPLADELRHEERQFTGRLSTSLRKAYSALVPHTTIFADSYRNLSTLNAWRSYVLEPKPAPEVLAFFLEAQNDALFSHCIARIGSWRSALQALRSAVENVLGCLYYKDHPVELELWKQGKHRLEFTALHQYFESHPSFSDLPPEINSLPLLKKEYGTLSRAVHGSAERFRMTADGYPTLMNPDLPRLRQWAARDSIIVRLINQVLLTLYKNELSGTRLRMLRESVGLVIPSRQFEAIKKSLGVTLISS